MLIQNLGFHLSFFAYSYVFANNNVGEEYRFLVVCPPINNYFT